MTSPVLSFNIVLPENDTPNATTKTNPNNNNGNDPNNSKICRYFK